MSALPAAPAPGARSLHRAPATSRPLILALMAVVAVFSVVMLVRAFHRPAVEFAASTGLALALLVFTGGIGWLLLRRIRPIVKPPAVPSVLGLGWGMFAATGCALLANAGLTNLWAQWVSIDFASDWGAALTAPVNEEWLKLVGVVLVGLALPGRVRGPMDGFVYGTLLGLGFQIVENLIYALNSITSTGATQTTGAVVGSFIARVVLTGPGSHWTMSGVAGAGVGLLFLRPRTGKRVAAAIGLVALAMGMHWFFNSPLIASFLGNVLRTGLNLCTAAVVYFLLRHRVRARGRGALHAWGLDPGLLTRRGRRRLRRQVPAGAQRVAATAEQHTQLTAVEQAAYSGP